MASYQDGESSDSNRENLLYQSDETDRTLGRGSGWYNIPTVYAFLPTFFLSAFAAGAVIAPMLNLILSLYCRAYYAEHDSSLAEDADRNCQVPEVHAVVSRAVMILGLIQSLIGALVSPKLGAWSDRIGRKRVLLIPICGETLAHLVNLMIARSSYIHVYRFLFIANVMSGLSGSLPCVMLIGQAYVADCTSSAKRASGFGLLRALFFAGISIGPIAGGLVINHMGSLVSVFYFSVSMQIINALYVAFVLPESLSDENRTHATELRRADSEVDLMRPRNVKYYLRRMNFLTPLRALWPNDGTRYIIKKNIILLSVIDTFFHGVEIGVLMNVLLYAELTFGWTSVATGIFISFSSFIRAFSLVVVLPLMVHYHQKWKPHILHEVGASKGDVFLIRISFLFCIVSYVVMALARNTTEFLIGGLLGAAGSIGSPTAASAITKHVPKQNTGAILGALSLLQSIATVIGPLVFSNIYASTVTYAPKTIFYVVIGLFGGSLGCSMFLKEHASGGLYDSGDGLDDEQAGEDAVDDEGRIRL
ncbi:major facilitator superfamily domain-containing protein [Myxozyma melibiosi]|uniref:Major facilitator superfamily domain-containing protein n=1 Tax=Myxozyma melibiosi TaxID=54550 RepID=A0ABR1F0N7_9ASCO